MTTLIVDYGMCNLGSVRRAFEECGADAVVSDDPAALDQASHIVLPGVGAFADGMKNLRDAGWVEPLKKAAAGDHVPLLGICLGMQLMAERGEEGGDIPGLGLIPGVIRRFQFADKNLRVPHVGWNEVSSVGDNALMEKIPQGSDFYFVHSYHFIPAGNDNILLKTPYGGNFVSGIRAGNIYGVQFHPEKSGRAGFELIRNFLRT